VDFTQLFPAISREKSHEFEIQPKSTLEIVEFSSLEVADFRKPPLYPPPHPTSVKQLRSMAVKDRD